MLKKDLEKLIERLFKRLKKRQYNVCYYKRLYKYQLKECTSLRNGKKQLKEERDSLVFRKTTLEQEKRWDQEEIEKLKEDLRQSEDVRLELEKALINQSITYSKGM